MPLDFSITNTMMKYKKVAVLVICSFAVLYHTIQSGTIDTIQRDLVSTERKLWNYFGNGQCEWTGSKPFDVDSDPHGTLFASYPASGMRVTWQQTEGLTGSEVSDDFFRLNFPKIGLVKTQFPHYEGIWSYGNLLDQTILLIRNPRWAMPSYHTLLSEIDYAHTWELAYDEIPNVFTRRAPMEDWLKWRDYRFDAEIILWGYHIDFYMSGGEQYWYDEDFERNGQYPFRLLNDTDRPWKKSYHCVHECDCYPKDVISYERLKEVTTGPNELRKIANVIRGKAGIDVIPDDAIDCIWHDTWVKTPNNNNDDRLGPPREAYNFTIPQLEKINDKLVEMRDKYSTGSWVNNSNAIALVENFASYIDGVTDELDSLYVNPPPTPAPNADYFQEILAWYQSKGKGNRYDKAKLQARGIWSKLAGFYPELD